MATLCCNLKRYRQIFLSIKEMLDLLILKLIFSLLNCFRNLPIIIETKSPIYDNIANSNSLVFTCQQIDIWPILILWPFRAVSWYEPNSDKKHGRLLKNSLAVDHDRCRRIKPHLRRGHWVCIMIYFYIDPFLIIKQWKALAGSSYFSVD